MEFKTADDGTIYAYDETGKQVGWVMTSCVPKKPYQKPDGKRESRNRPEGKSKK